MNVVKFWKKFSKGPAVTDKELNAFRRRVAKGKRLTVHESRRLLQTLDSEWTHVEFGLVKEFPPLGSKVYTEVFRDSVIPDVFEGEVIAHLSDGTVKVKTLLGEHLGEENWGTWFTDMAKYKRQHAL